MFVRSPFLSSKKRALCCTVTQKEMRYEGSQGKALPMTRSRMVPPTPLQNSHASFEEERRGHFEVVDQMWSARDRAIIEAALWKNVKVLRWKLESWNLCWAQTTRR